MLSLDDFRLWSFCNVKNETVMFDCEKLVLPIQNRSRYALQLKTSFKIELNNIKYDT